VDIRDGLSHSSAFRVLTVIGHWSRWSPILDVANSMSGAGVVAALDRTIAEHRCPTTIPLDRGTGSTSRALDEHAHRRRVSLVFMTPGKPTEKGAHRVIQRQAAGRVLKRAVVRLDS
jgi:putative transposase